jgi:hypothetical protein
MRPLRSPWQEIGWPGVAGLAALMAAAALAARPAPPAAPPPVVAAARAVAPLPQRVAQLLDLAQQQGVTVRRTEQRKVAEPAPGTLLSMPARSAYAGLRGFVELALLHDPDLALTTLRLQRGREGDAELEAELVWWLAAETAR